MAEVNSMVSRWIPQLDDWDQSSAFFAYQSLEQEVFEASRPGNEEGMEALALALGEALSSDLSSGAKRQVARLLAYIPTDATVSRLDAALDDLEVREMARWALETNPSHRATAALIRAMGLPGNTFRVGVVNSLRQHKCVASTTALRKAANDPQLEVRTAALLALADTGDAKVDPVLEKATRSEFAEERRVAEIARARLGAG